MGAGGEDLKAAPCPSCGHCPTCGRGPAIAVPVAPLNPWGYPWGPHWWMQPTPVVHPFWVTNIGHGIEQPIPYPVTTTTFAVDS